MSFVESKNSSIINLLKSHGTGYKNHDDIIFIKNNYLIKPFNRLGVYSVHELEKENNELINQQIFDCNIPGCYEKFNTINLYENHYNSHHRFICIECKKTLPSNHLLDLHLSEKHDSYFAVVSQKKPSVSFIHQLYFNNLINFQFF